MSNIREICRNAGIDMNGIVDADKIINGTTKDDSERFAKGNIRRPQFSNKQDSAGSNAKKYRTYKLAQLVGWMILVRYVIKVNQMKKQIHNGILMH